MIERSDRLRISQTALTKAGALRLHKSLNPEETLSGLLKYMVEKSAIASGRTRDLRASNAKRRRYGDFILVLVGKTLVDVLVSRPDWCQACLGIERDRCTICN